MTSSAAASGSAEYISLILLMDLVFTFSKLIFFASFVALGCLNILAAAWPFCFFINSIVSFDNLFSKSKDFKNCI